MEKKTRKTYSEETYDLSNAHVHDVLKQRKDSGEPLVIYKGEDGALYSDNGQSLWRVVDEKRFNTIDSDINKPIIAKGRCYCFFASFQSFIISVLDICFKVPLLQCSSQ